MEIEGITTFCINLAERMWNILCLTDTPYTSSCTKWVQVYEFIRLLSFRYILQKHKTQPSTASRHSSPTWCSGFMFEGNGRETKTKKYETKVEKDMHERRKEHERTRHVPKRTLMNAKRKPGKARQYTKRIPKNATGNARKHTKRKPKRTRKWETKPGKARKDTKRKPKRTRKWETKPQEKHERTPNERRQARKPMWSESGEQGKKVKRVNVQETEIKPKVVQNGHKITCDANRQNK